MIELPKPMVIAGRVEMPLEMEPVVIEGQVGDPHEMTNRLVC